MKKILVGINVDIEEKGSYDTFYCSVHLEEQGVVIDVLDESTPKEEYSKIALAHGFDKYVIVTLAELMLNKLN